MGSNMFGGGVVVVVVVVGKNQPLYGRVAGKTTTVANMATSILAAEIAMDMDNLNYWLIIHCSSLPEQLLCAIHEVVLP